MIKTILDGAEALTALAQHGTVTEAAHQLGLSQSAVSKRLQALERAVGHPVLVPDGRRVALTVEGQELLDRARPLLSGIRDLGAPRRPGPVAWSLTMDDGLAASWGPGRLAEAVRGLKRFRLVVSAARAGLVPELVRTGAHEVGLAVDPTPDAELLAESVVSEPWVLVHSELDRRPGPGPLLLAGVPRTTFADAEPELALRTTTATDSFAAALRLATAGFGDALVPLGLALEADLPRKSFRTLGVARTVHLLTRRSLAGMSAFVELRDALRERAERHLHGKRK